MPDWSVRLSELATTAAVPGAVLGIWADGELTVVPYGVLNTATGVETTADSVFHLGSVTKPWTATMIVQLVAEGRLQLDDAVVKLLPGAPIDPRVTVRQLLTHTSGIDGDVFTDTGRGDDCVERYVELLGAAELLFEPGTAYSYCNAGYVVLGRIIEVLDGRGWDASLRARLIEPLGLTKTCTLPEEAILHRAAVGHVIPEGTPVRSWQLPRSIGPAGTIAATAGDLLEFARLHLTDDRYRAMREPQGLTVTTSADLGLCWRLYEWGGRSLFGHDGSTIGQKAFLRIDPEADVAVCVLTNSGNGSALFEPLISEVFTHYTGVAHPAAPEPIDVPTDDRHVGSYARASVQIDVVRRADGELGITYRATGDRLAFTEQAVIEYDLRPTAPADGNHFVTRDSPQHPWVPITFFGTHVLSADRFTPKLS
ncbi:beta-lactamase family protein [Kribbella sandramycini]|uniref:Beta-lactamase family protein n=1 Tax=Kribbella sandramycini TaxID=60450 RepID=A0A7Y4NYK6_9ACTN|nr:serine hydrolase domain-containing protein [Kribbella sandramycini]MBB6568161.1 CubicO group peptidase (beta-lactamase class C family) [Kribbella sandramycini]NOL39245.1 beta-lactamase family protein [Kribbella sandramycini]